MTDRAGPRPAGLDVERRMAAADAAKPRRSKSVTRLENALATLQMMGEPYFGGSLIGGSRVSHTDSSRHPDPRGAPWRNRAAYAEQLVNDLAHRIERMVDSDEPLKSWRCHNCRYHRLQPASWLFCGKCGAPRPVEQNDPRSQNASRNGKSDIVAPQGEGGRNA